jgi:hypothetical protein
MARSGQRTTLQLAEKVLLRAFNGAMGVRQALQASDTLVIPVFLILLLLGLD